MNNAETDIAEVHSPAPLSVTGEGIGCACCPSCSPECDGDCCDTCTMGPDESQAIPSNVDLKEFTAADANKFYRLSEVSVDLDEDGSATSWIPVLPEGIFQHPSYGELNFNQDFLLELVRLFQADVLHVMIPVDVDHDGGAAVAWVTDLQVRPGFGLFALVAWTPPGMQLVKDKTYRYVSAELSSYQDEVTGVLWPICLRAITITNRPFMKRMEALALSFKEAAAIRLEEAQSITEGDSTEMDETTKALDETPSETAEVEVLAEVKDEGESNADDSELTEEEEMTEAPATEEAAAEVETVEEVEASEGSTSEIPAPEEGSAEEEKSESADEEKAEDEETQKKEDLSETVAEVVVELTESAEVLKELAELSQVELNEIKALLAETRAAKALLEIQLHEQKVDESIRQLTTGTFTFSKPVLDRVREVSLSDSKIGDEVVAILNMVRDQGMIELGERGVIHDPDLDADHDLVLLSGPEVDPKTGRKIAGRDVLARVQEFCAKNGLNPTDPADYRTALMAITEPKAHSVKATTGRRR